MSTPRLLHLFIGTMLAAVIATILGIIFFTILALSEGDQLSEVEVWIIPLLGPALIAGITVMIGLPIAALVRALAPQSVPANLTGFILFVAIAALFFGRPFTIDSGWVALRVALGLFGALAISMALLVSRLATRRAAVTSVDLTDTFD
jgi:hypothetical protein